MADVSVGVNILHCKSIARLGANVFKAILRCGNVGGAGVYNISIGNRSEGRVSELFLEVTRSKSCRQSLRLMVRHGIQKLQWLALSDLVRSSFEPVSILCESQKTALMTNISVTRPEEEGWAMIIFCN
jgi:hypothetical protein